MLNRRDQVAMKIADAMRESQGKGTPAPEDFEAWTTEYFKQPACGEVIFEAPIHFTKEKPQAAINWYEANVGPMQEEEKKVLLKTPR